MFENTCVIETRLSDFHLMAVTVTRKTFKTISPRVVGYRSYQDFAYKTFRVSLINNLSNKVFVNDRVEKF